MAASRDTSNRDSQENLGRVSEKRRRLLKAAAASAPVIATLQSGGAFANASAFQCIDSTTNDTPDGATPGTDVYVRERIAATEYTHTTNPSKWKYTVGGTEYDENGDPWQDPGRDYSAEPSIDLNALVYYTPINNNMSVVPSRIYPQPQAVPDQVLAESCLASIIT